MANRKPAKPCSVAKEKDIHVFLTYFMERHVSSKILLCLHSTAIVPLRLSTTFFPIVFLSFYSIPSELFHIKRGKNRSKTKTLFLISLFHNSIRFSFCFSLFVIFAGIRVKGSQHCRQMNTLWNEKQTKLVHVLRVKQQLLGDYKDVRSSGVGLLSDFVFD